ncbi:MAG: DNA-directed RNA polymerase subunit omega [Proteobacteria bacterium]|nr:DNA-directed RNA polymerase subunit omega [Pseudomonadota bacterium]MBU4471428.1 DNA-directed RNA polymerase subunit omega [Pseudomonadota bacterium]MCG2752433.1 DNA-directed RNA polymerase subunit omega [Desulfobacteraceae bacterium]
MARITVEDCLKKVSNRFVLVNIASSRVRQIREGAEYLINSPKNEDIVMALREIAAGKVRMKEPVPVKKTTKLEKQPVEKMEEDMNDE